MFAILLLILISLSTECTAQDSLACTLVSQLSCGKFPVKVLCATNGQEFQNDCEFAQAHCHYPAIRLYREGTCPQTGSLDVNGTLAVDVVCKAIGASQCPPDKWEVCANNGVTYHNLCQYQKQHCKHPEIQIVKTGACIGATTTTMATSSSDYMPTTATASHTSAMKKSTPGSNTSATSPTVTTSATSTSTMTTPTASATTSAVTTSATTISPASTSAAATSAAATKSTVTTSATTTSAVTTSAAATSAAAITSTVTTSATTTSAVTTSATTISPATTSAASTSAAATTSTVTTSATTTSASTTVNTYCQILETATCPTKAELLCGTDGVTYTNMCHLYKVKCHHPWIDTRHDGMCQTTTSTSATTTHPSLSGICQVLVSAQCNPHMEQMCGSDGITYDNKCELEKGRCYNPGLQVVHDGSCATSTTQTPVLTTMDFICQALILGQCQPNVDKVCASNGVTYRNMCMFQQAKCHNKFLTDIHMGKCTTPHVANLKVARTD